MKRFVLLACALGGAAACGDNIDPNGGTAIDAAAIDGATIDAPPPDIDAATDAAVDAAPIQFSGTVTIIEAQVLAPAPAPANTIVAEGVQLGITFTDSATAVAPILDTNPGTLFGCKVTELTTAQLQGALGVNEGSVQFTVNNGGAPANPVYPACVFIPTQGYICPDATSSQAITVVNSVTVDQVNANASRITVNGGTATFAADDVGRYIKFSGTGNPFLDTSYVAFPIAQIMSPTVVIVATGSPLLTIGAVAGQMTTLGGVGPLPGLVDPGQLADGASATAVITPGGGNHFPATTITYGNVGDDFTMDDSNAGIMRNLPSDGSAFTLTCATCGTSIGTVLNITTTDGSVAGLPATTMPPPATKRVNIRCAEVGTGTITVPANVSAHLAGATRIQTNYVRGTFGAPSPANAGLAGVISGHAIVGFTTPN
jgi:hypothetical protein